MQAETRQIQRDNSQTQRENQEIRRQAKDIQRERACLAREKFQFNASQAALKALPLLDQFTAEDHERERNKFLAIRKELFGDAPIPESSWLHPNNDPKKKPVNQHKPA